MPTFQTPPPDADLEQEVVRLIELEDARLDNRRAWFEVVLEHRTNALTANERFALQLNRDIDALRADLMDVHDRKDELERAVYNKAQEQARLQEMLDDAWKQNLINRKYIDAADQENEKLNAQNRAMAMQATQVENQMCEILGRFQQMEADNTMLYQTIKDANRAVNMSTTVLTQVKLDAAQREQMVEGLLEEQSLELRLLQEAFDRMVGGVGQMYVDHMQDVSAETESWEDPTSENSDHDHDEPRVVEVTDHTLNSLETVAPFTDTEDGNPKADAAALLSSDYIPAGGYYDRRESPSTIATEQVGSFITDINHTPGPAQPEHPVDFAAREADHGHTLVETLCFNTWRARGLSEVEEDSDDEDESDSGTDDDWQQHKRQHGASHVTPPETEMLSQEPPKCWCSKVGTLADSMNALTLEDLVVEVSNKQQAAPGSPTRVTLANGSSPEGITTSVFSALRQQSGAGGASEDPYPTQGTYRSIAIQTEDLSDTTSSGRTRPLGGPPRPSRSFNPDTNGPVYLSPWYDWAPWWMCRRASSQVGHASRKVDLPYPKVKRTRDLADDIEAPLSPIRRTLTDPLIRMPARDYNVLTYQEESTATGYRGTGDWIRYTPSLDLEDKYQDIRRHRRRARPPPVSHSSWKDWLLVVLGIVMLVWSLIPGAGERRDREIRNDVKNANELPAHILQEIRDNSAKNEHRLAHMVNYEAQKRSQQDRVELG